MIVLAKRNMKIFFRDKANVFFSMLVVLITLAIYLLFLGDNLTGGLEFSNAEPLVIKWLMAGILAITSLTATLGAFGILVNDRAQKIDKDFLATPISNLKRVAGYLLGTFSVGFVMTVFTYIIAQAYLYYQFGDLFTAMEFMTIMGITFLSVLSSTAMMFMLVELFTSPMAFETAMSVISSLVGFLAGIYIPMGQLPTAVQYFGMLFPVSHGASLYRQVMMDREMAEAFQGAPGEAVEGFELAMGNIFEVGDTILSPAVSVSYLILATIVFYGLAVFMSRRKKK